MADMMVFPDTWEEFEEQYGITDREQIYTNGARLIPSFRVKQWLDHIADHKTEPQPCEWCKFSDGENCFSQEPCKVMLYFKTEPQTERAETMSCQECKHYEVGKPCKPFLNECDCHYEPQTDKGVSYSDHTDYKEPKTYVTWTEPQTDCSWQKGE